MLTPIGSIKDDPRKQAVFRDGASLAIPDPSVYSDWFRSTDERQRRIAVGQRRLAVVKNITQQDVPPYEYFVDPQTGLLLSAKQLERERPRARAERLAKVRALIADRQEMIQQVSTWGWVEPPEGPRLATT